MKETQYGLNLNKAFDSLKKGAFLTTIKDDKVNVMTISWGYFGISWNKPVFMTMVRNTRLTHDNIESSNEFTVSLPSEDKQKDLIFCGSNSGRDIDKLKECNIGTLESENIKTPRLNIKGTHYECRVIYKTDMSDINLDKNIEDSFYSDNDYHTLYFGEIIDSYVTE